MIPTQASTQADAGARSNLSGVAQTAQIQATAQNQANATANGNTFGLVAIGVVLTKAKDQSQTAAYSLGSFAGQSLTINAQASDTASSNAGATTGGLLAIAPNNTATTTVQPTVGAAIGGDPINSSIAATTGTVTATGNVNVTATDNPEGDATTSNATYGGVAVGGAVTNDTISPTVTSYVDTGTTIEADGSVSVFATGTPQASANAPTYNIQSVNTTSNTLDVQNNGLQAGQTVLYDNEGNTPIQGLQGETDGSNPDGIGIHTPSCPSMPMTSSSARPSAAARARALPGQSRQLHDRLPGHRHPPIRRPRAVRAGRLGPADRRADSRWEILCRSREPDFNPADQLLLASRSSAKRLAKFHDLVDWGRQQDDHDCEQWIHPR